MPETSQNPEVILFRSKKGLSAIGLIWVVCFSCAAFAQDRFQITRIPTAEGANSVALGINSKGEVAGYSFQGEDYHAFLYSSSDQSLTDVGSLGGKINAACAINDAGQVTGYSQDENGNLLAFLFSRNQPIASLGTLEGASTSEAFGINSTGAVVGDSQSGTQNHRPMLFSNGSIQDLGLGGSNEPDALETAYAINDAGQIVGRHSAGNSAFHAFVFQNGKTTDLSTLGGANGEALAINKNGQVAGDSDTPEGAAHAFVFDHSQLKDLGTLPGFDNTSYARGINNSGDIVGESDSADQKRAFLYTKGHLVELDKLAKNLSEVGFSSLDVAYGINDKGWIVGYGTTSDNLTAAFVAVPEGRGNQGTPSGLQRPQEQRRAEPAQPQSQDRGPGQHVSESNEENYDVFYSRLSSDEGSWVDAGNYGNCFRPRVSQDWRPYRDGHWVWTDQGWYWDSNERFAWATYHYGRWVDIGGTGWCWVPGNQWAPAWVSWRESDEDIGWAPLPPEADVSGNGSISSWSDSYYDVGPAAYAFISFSHWHEPSYARYVEPPERNVQIINETRNVTNIVTNNNVINNFGPAVQTVATKTNRNIQQVSLALSPTTDPKAKYGQTLQGNRLKVVAPPVNLKPESTHSPTVQNRIENPQVERGWQGVKPQDAEKLKKVIAGQNPPPKGLPKPTPFVNLQIGNKGQVSGSPGATGSPAAVAGQKTPPNLVKPGGRPPNAKITPSASPNKAAAGEKSVPPNLLGPRTSGTPGASPTLKPSGARSPNVNATAGPSPNKAAAGSKSVPPNLLGGKASGTPGASPMVKPSGTSGASLPEPGGKPTQPGSPVLKQSPSGNGPAGPPIPTKGTPPTEEKKPVTAPTPTSQVGPADQTTPKPTHEVKPARREISAPGPTTVATPPRKPVAAPKPAAEVKAAAPSKQEIKTPPPQVQHVPIPQSTVRHVPAAQPQAHKSSPPKREIKTPPPQVQHAPVPQPSVRHVPAAPPQQAHKIAPPKQEVRTPPPQVQHAPVPQPPVRHAPAAPAQQAHKTAPPSPQGGQKHEPAKGKPTPAPKPAG